MAKPWEKAAGPQTAPQPKKPWEKAAVSSQPPAVAAPIDPPAPFSSPNPMAIAMENAQRLAAGATMPARARQDGWKPDQWAAAQRGQNGSQNPADRMAKLSWDSYNRELPKSSPLPMPRDSAMFEPGRKREAEDRARFEIDPLAPSRKAAGPSVPRVPKAEVDQMRGAWDKRVDGSAKGDGWLGVLKRPDGGVSSEISVGLNFGGKEVELPVLVPTLSSDEVNAVLGMDEKDPQFWDKLPGNVRQKVIDHAQGRIGKGQSPFAGPNETPYAISPQPSVPTPTWQDKPDIDLPPGHTFVRDNGKLLLRDPTGEKWTEEYWPGIIERGAASDWQEYYRGENAKKAAANQPKSGFDQTMSDVGRGLIAPLQQNENARTIAGAPINFGQGLGDAVRNVTNSGLAMGTDAVNTVRGLADPNAAPFEAPRTAFMKDNALVDPGGALYSDAGVIPRMVGQIAAARVPIGKNTPFGGLGHMAAKDAAAIAITSDPTMGRGSDFIPSNTPGFGPVADALRSREGDSTFASLMKTGAEDLLLSGVTAGVGKAIGAPGELLAKARGRVPNVPHPDFGEINPEAAAQARRILGRDLAELPEISPPGTPAPAAPYVTPPYPRPDMDVAPPEAAPVAPPAARSGPPAPVPFSKPPIPNGKGFISGHADQAVTGAIGGFLGGGGDAFAASGDNGNGGNPLYGAGTGAAIGIFGPRAMANVGGRGFRAAARTVSRGARSGFDERVAAAEIRKALKAGGITGVDEGLAADIERFGGDLPTAVLDFSQRATNLATGISRLPGEGGDAAAKRYLSLTDERAARHERALEKATGLSPSTVTGDIKRMSEEAQAVAKPEYDALRSTYKTLVSNRLDQMTEESPTLSSSVDAVEFYKAERLATKKQGMGDFEKWDLVKRDLDHKEQALIDKGVSRDDLRIQNIDNARTELVKEMDRLIPDQYAAARLKGGEAPRIRSAFEEGKKYIGGSYTPEEVLAKVSKWTGVPLTAAQSGALRTIMGKTDGAGAAIASLRTPKAKKQIAAVFGQAVADNIDRRFAADASVVHTSSRVAPNVGSVTSQAGLGGGDGALAVAANLWKMGSSPVQAALAAMSKSGAFTEAQRNLMSEMLQGGMTRENLERIFRGQRSPPAPRQQRPIPPTSRASGAAAAATTPPGSPPMQNGAGRRPLPGETSNASPTATGAGIGFVGGAMAPAQNDDERTRNIMMGIGFGGGVGGLVGLKARPYGDMAPRGGRPRPPVPKRSVAAEIQGANKQPIVKNGFGGSKASMGEQYSFKHLDAIKERLAREQGRLGEAKTAKEREFRAVQVSQIEKELANEINFLKSKGITPPDEMSIDDLAAELEGLDAPKPTQNGLGSSKLPMDEGARMAPGKVDIPLSNYGGRMGLQEASSTLERNPTTRTLQRMAAQASRGSSEPPMFRWTTDVDGNMYVGDANTNMHDMMTDGLRKIGVKMPEGRGDAWRRVDSVDDPAMDTAGMLRLKDGKWEIQSSDFGWKPFDPSQSGSSKLLAGMGDKAHAGTTAASAGYGYFNPVDANNDGQINDADRLPTAAGAAFGTGVGVGMARGVLGYGASKLAGNRLGAGMRRGVDEVRTQGFGAGRKTPPNKLSGPVKPGSGVLGNVAKRAAVGAATGAAVNLATSAGAQEDITGEIRNTEGKISSVEQEIAALKKAKADFDKITDPFEKQRFLKAAGLYAGKIEGNIAGATTVGINAWDAKNAKALERAEAALAASKTELTEMRKRDAYRQMQKGQNTFADALKEAGPSAALILGGIAATVLRVRGVGKSAKAAKLIENDINDLLTSGPVRNLVKKGGVAGEERNRAANMNQFYREGGAPDDKLPFNYGTGGWKYNSRAAKPGALFSRKTVTAMDGVGSSFIRPNDIKLIGAGLLDSGGMQPFVSGAEEELKNAKEDAEKNKDSVEALRRVERAETSLKFYETLQRFGFSLAATGALGAAYRYKLPKPDVRGAEDEVTKIADYLKSQMPPKPPRIRAPATPKPPALAAPLAQILLAAPKPKKPKPPNKPKKP